MEDAANMTAKAYTSLQHLRHMEKGDSGTATSGMTMGGGAISAEEALGEKGGEKEKKIAPEIAVMQPILRFLQLLCENHNHDLQVSVG